MFRALWDAFGDSLLRQLDAVFEYLARGFVRSTIWGKVRGSSLWVALGLAAFSLSIAFAIRGAYRLGSRDREGNNPRVKDNIDAGDQIDGLGGAAKRESVATLVLAPRVTTQVMMAEIVLRGFYDEVSLTTLLGAARQHLTVGELERLLRREDKVSDSALTKIKADTSDYRPVSSQFVYAYPSLPAQVSRATGAVVISMFPVVVAMVEDLPDSVELVSTYVGTNFEIQVCTVARFVELYRAAYEYSETGAEDNDVETATTPDEKILKESERSSEERVPERAESLRRPPSNALAGWSVALGPLSYFLAMPLLGVVAVICGHLYWSGTQAGQGSHRGLALCGIISGYVSLALYAGSLLGY